MAMFGKKPSKRRRKSGRVRGGIQSTGGEWMTESGSDSETESPSKTDKKKAKKKKSPKKSSLVKGEDDEFKSAISHTDGDQSGEETVPETSKKETPKIVVTGPQEIVVKEKETSKVNPDEDQKEKGADDREVEPMEQDPPPGEKIGAEGKSVTKDQIDGTEEVEYTEWAKQQEVSKVLSSQVNNAAKIEANVLILGGSNSKRAGERLMKISGSSEVKIVTTNFCKGGQKISTMCNKIHNLRKEQKENTSVAIVHVGCVNFPCDKEEAKHNFERYKEEVDMLHQECPNADIVMMGIIPRSGESEFISQANSQIRNFNKNLDGHKELNEKFYYLDSWKYLVDSETDLVKAALYKEDDPEGIHLNPDGQDIIARAWLDEIERLSVMHHERSLVSTAEGNSEGKKPLATQV